MQSCIANYKLTSCTSLQHSIPGNWQDNVVSIAFSFPGIVLAREKHLSYCHNPITTQHNLNTVVGLDTKMTVQTPNRSLQEPQINIYWPQLNIMWPIATRATTTRTSTTSTTKSTALEASDYHLLTTKYKYNMISSNKLGHNNIYNNNNKNNNDINNNNRTSI